MKTALLMTCGLVLPVMAQQVEGDIRGPKPMIEIPAPEPVTPWLGYGMWEAFALLGIGALVWWLMRRKAPVVSAEERARLALAGLEREAANLAAGDFALAVSQVVRDFIKGEFGLAAPKWTTEEFLQKLAEADVEPLRNRMEPLRGFLKSCDMAKFAGVDLGIGERGELVAKARAFVDVPSTVQSKEAG